MSISILVADDHKMVREGLCALLRDRPDLNVIGQANDGREAVAMARESDPDVVIMDVAMPGLNGPSATRLLKRDCPNVSVIGLSMHADSRFVTSMLKAGASAYLLKTCDSEELFRAIDIASAGGVYLCPEVAGTVLDGPLTGPPGQTPQAPDLSGRETEVLQLLAEGRNSKQIARLLHVSSRTIDSHRRRIMQKLDITTLAELTKYAVRIGLTSIDA